MRQPSQKGCYLLFYRADTGQLFFYTRTVMRADGEEPAFDSNINNAKVYGRRGSAEHAAAEWAKYGYKLTVMEDKRR